MQTGFRETLRADIDHGRFQPPEQRSPNMNIVIVSHGVTLRVFLMRWYKWTVEQFEGLNNLGNGDMIVMEKGYGGRYSTSYIERIDKLSICLIFYSIYLQVQLVSASHQRRAKRDWIDK